MTDHCACPPGYHGNCQRRNAGNWTCGNCGATVPRGGVCDCRPGIDLYLQPQAWQVEDTQPVKVVRVKPIQGELL